MNTDLLKRLLSKLQSTLPPGISLNLPLVSIDPGTLAHHLGQSGTSPELREFADQIGRLESSSTETFVQLRSDLAAFGVTTQKHYQDILTNIRQALDRLKQEAIPPCFLPAADAFAALVAKNFLFEFEGSESDYVQLLSTDLRRLFFSFFKEHLRSGHTNRLVVSGREGSGKTFNTLLLSLQLSREDYHVHYCQDISSSSLTADAIRKLVLTPGDPAVFIIDNAQHDVLKVEDLVGATSIAGPQEDGPFFLFLTRPLDEDTMLDTFGRNTPVISLRDRFIDFERLVRLFFCKLGAEDCLPAFLESATAGPLPRLLLKYRNMALWNEILRSMDDAGPLVISEEAVMKQLHSFLRRREPWVLELRVPISRLLPFFALGMSIRPEYCREIIGDDADAVLRSLAESGVLNIVEHDWESEAYADTSTLLVAPRWHPIKSKLVSAVLSKYYPVLPTSAELVVDYSERYCQNLYHIIGAYSDPEDFRRLCGEERFRTILRQYFLERKLGKKLDRVIRRLVDLDETTMESLFDPEVLAVFAAQVNGDHAYVVSKMYLFRSLQRVSPKKAYALFCLTVPEAVTGSFLGDSTKRGMTSLAKWMEVFKNIYYYAPTLSDKSHVQDFVRTVVDATRDEFLQRFERSHDYFTQLHWMLKRLHGLKLGAYFLEGIPADKLIEFIRRKNINIVELCRYVLLNARYASTSAPDGSTRRYYDVLRETLSYEDLKRIFDNSRSDLFDLAINATHDFVAKALVEYCNDPAFRRKAALEKPELRDNAVELIRTNYLLTDVDKSMVMTAIKESASTP